MVEKTKRRRGPRAAPPEVHQARVAIAHFYPAAFRPVKVYPKFALAIGIDAQIKAAFPEMSKRLIQRFLHDYCSGPSYHHCMVEGARRVNLDGSDAGEVSARAIEHAGQMLAKREAHIKRMRGNRERAAAKKLTTKGKANG